MKIEANLDIRLLTFLILPALFILFNAYALSNKEDIKSQEVNEESFIEIEVEADTITTFQFTDSSEVRFTISERFNPTLEENEQESFWLHLNVIDYNKDATIILSTLILQMEVPDIPVEINKEYTNFTSDEYHPDLYEPYKFFVKSVIWEGGVRYEGEEIESGKFVLTELTTSYAKGEFEIIYAADSELKRIEGEFIKSF